ncbi:hypothetical protein VNO77_27940 [Canavalia gladiata]|uniref:Uncharacterized protein n=1 Tax=Canavalia gladiata TaxID=3824 RepID=A0AAN9KVM2_CANGL
MDALLPCRQNKHQYWIEDSIIAEILKSQNVATEPSIGMIGHIQCERLSSIQIVQLPNSHLFYSAFPANPQTLASIVVTTHRCFVVSLPFKAFRL